MKQGFLTILMLFLVSITFSQNQTPRVAGIRFEEKTTAQIQALTNPTEGYQVYNTDTKSMWLYNGTTWNNSGLSLEQISRISNSNVYRRIVVSTDNVTSLATNARTTDSPYEGKVRTVINGNYTFLLSDNEPLYTPFTVEAGENVTDSIIIKRDDPAISLIIDGRQRGLSVNDFDGVTLLPLKTAVIEKINTNVYKISCDCNTYTEPVVEVCTANPNERHTNANAASDPNCNEANSSSGWQWNGLTQSTATIQTTNPYAGTYYFRYEVTSLGGGAMYGQYNLSVTAGDTYTVSMWLRSTSLSNGGGTAAWTNCTGGPNVATGAINADGTWQLKTFNITAIATGTIEIRVYSSFTVADLVGDFIELDGVSIIKTN